MSYVRALAPLPMNAPNTIHASDFLHALLR